MTGYVRNDTANNIADGNIINASDLDGEFDAIQAAFVNTTGHTHDGTAAEGAPITKIGPTQDVVASATELVPKTNNALDLGTSGLRFKNVYAAGTAYIGSLDLTNALSVADGGTGATTLTGVVKGNGTSAFTAGNVNLASEVTGTLPVANGGTGATTFTTNNVLLGNGTGAFQVVAPGSAGNVLSSNGTTWTSTALPPGGLVYAFTTTPITLTDKQGALTDTSGGAFTVTLPAAPAVGAQVVVADAGNAWGTNNLTIARNGSTIGNLAEDLVCDISGVSVQLVYDGTTWEVYAQVGGNSGNVVTVSATQTLTNKTIAFGSNTLTDVASTNTSQTLTNKTLGSGTLFGANVSGQDNNLTRVDLQDYGYVYFNSGTTNALNFENGSHQRWAPNTGAQTLSISNWPPTGNLGELLIEGVNLGAATITWPTINWIKSDGTTTTTFSQNGVTLQTSGIDWVFLWTRDAGTTIYGKIVR